MSARVFDGYLSKKRLRRGTLSSALSMIFLVLITLALLASMLRAYEVSLQGIHKSVIRSKEIIIKSMNDIGVVAIGNCSIIMYPKRGPIRVLDVVLLRKGDEGIVRAYVVKRNINVDHPTMLLNESLVRSVLNDENASVLVLLDSGNYVKLNRYDITRLCRISMPNPTLTRSVTSTSEDSILSSVYGKGSYVIAGRIIDWRSFLRNPIPGSTTDPGANFVPEVYVDLSGNLPSGFIGDRLKVKRSGNSYYFEFNDANQGFMFLIPILLNRHNTSVMRFDISMKLTPLARAYNLGDYWVWFEVWFWYRPAVYVVLPEDYLRTPLVTAGSSVLLGAQFKNSVARAIYWDFGGPSNSDPPASCLYAYSYYYTDDASVTDSASMVVTVNPQEVFRNVPNAVDTVVVLVGFFGYIEQEYEYGEWRAVPDYAELEVNVSKLG